MPLASIPDQLIELSRMKDQEIIVHCKTGKRSNQANIFLKSICFFFFAQTCSVVGMFENWYASRFRSAAACIFLHRRYGFSMVSCRLPSEKNKIINA